jgi:transposase InsO family protein
MPTTAARVPLKLPVRPDEVWTMDFTQDAFAGGRKFRTLNLMDGFTRYAPRIEVDTSLPGQRVVRVLEELKRRGRKPEAIVIDNGTESQNHHPSLFRSLGRRLAGLQWLGFRCFVLFPKLGQASK